MPESTRILLCECARAEMLPQDVKRDVLAALNSAGVAIDRVEDLCGMVARRDPLLKKIAQADEASIVACYPRAVRWLFYAAGAPLQSGVNILNMRTQTAGEIVGKLLGPAGAEQAERSLLPAMEPDGWVPWFPVIDRDRCVDCQQCLDFCLFGVYAVAGDGAVEVRNPANCKTNCPACARVCPEVAIIFPKYKSSPINGDEVTEADRQREPVKVDLAALAGGDVYAKLRQRRSPSKRFAADRDDEQSRSDRLAMLEQLGEQLDVPADVFESLCGARTMASAGAEEQVCDCECNGDCNCGGDSDCGCDCECHAAEVKENTGGECCPPDCDCYDKNE